MPKLGRVILPTGMVYISEERRRGARKPSTGAAGATISRECAFRRGGVDWVDGVDGVDGGGGGDGVERRERRLGRSPFHWGRPQEGVGGDIDIYIYIYAYTYTYTYTYADAYTYT